MLTTNYFRSNSKSMKVTAEVAEKIILLIRAKS